MSPDSAVAAIIMPMSMAPSPSDFWRLLSRCARNLERRTNMVFYGGGGGCCASSAASTLQITRGFEALGASGRELGLRRLQVGQERRVGLQYRDGCGCHQATLDHIAVPMNV